MRKQIIITLLALLLIPCMAEGVDWVLTTSDEYGKNYVDVDSVKKDRRNIYRVWEKTEYKNPNSALRTLYYREHNCKERQYQTIHYTEFRKDGTENSETYLSGGWYGWRLIAPDSQYEKVHNLVCSSIKGWW